MTSLFKFFKKYNTLSKEAEHAISEISKIIIVKKNTDLQPIGLTTSQCNSFIKKLTDIN